VGVNCIVTGAPRKNLVADATGQYVIAAGTYDGLNCDCHGFSSCLMPRC